MPQNLSGPKIVEISTALEVVYPGWGDLSKALISLDIKAGSLLVPFLSYGQNLTQIVRDASASGWLPRLVDAAVAKAPGDQTLRDIQKLLKPAEIPAGIECFDLCRLGAQIMVNRKEFRNALRAMTQPNGKRILVVRGDRRSGKSHGKQLILHVTQRLGVKYCLIDLAEFSVLNELLQPVDIATSLVQSLQFQMILPPMPTDSQWARWTINFCNAFTAHANQTPESTWLVIDGFNSVLRSPETLNFVNTLASRIDNPLIHYRLVLLGFDDNLPSQLTLNIAKSTTPKLSELTDEELKVDLITFFDIASRQDGVNVPDEILAAKVGRVMAQAGARNEDFLLNLAILAGEELQNWAA